MRGKLEVLKDRLTELVIWSFIFLAVLFLAASIFPLEETSRIGVQAGVLAGGEIIIDTVPPEATVVIRSILGPGEHQVFAKEDNPLRISVDPGDYELIVTAKDRVGRSYFFRLLAGEPLRLIVELDLTPQKAEALKAQGWWVAPLAILLVPTMFLAAYFAAVAQIEGGEA